MVKAGDKTLESYLYAPNNGPLITVAYGNGDTQEILYDKEERIRARRWNGESTDAVRYEYDDYGTLEKETDLVNGRIDKDQYDMTGRLVQSTTLEKNTGAAGEPTVANTHTVQSLEIGYDSYNRVNRLVQSLEGSKTKTGLVYGDASKTQRPGLSYGLTVDGTQRQSLAYDAMARCTKETVTLPGGQKRENCFTYGTLRHLTDTDRDLFTYRTDGWRDQLLSWNGKSYAYDAGGNPTVLRGMALTWGEGRRLKRIAATAGEVTFAYDSDGKRVKKTSGNTETKYYYNGSTLSGLVRTTTGNTGTTKTTVQFVYDAEGKPFLLRLNGKTDYFYLYNGLGDVTGLVDRSNQVVVRYQYNSWGKVTSTQDTSGVSLATLNPFCYRKYVYDPETGLYCLGSRYYDPEVGRFVNADDTDVIFAKPQELGSKNLYAYCDNNPVAREDYAGEFPIPCIVGAVVGAAVSGFSYVLTSGGEIDGVELAKSCLVGAISGALAPLKGGFLMAAAIVNGINTAINTEGDPVTRVVYGIIEGGATYIAGNRANKVTDMVQFGSKAAEALGNAAVNYSIGQPMELAATGVSAAAKPVTKAIAKNMGIATSNARTTKRSNTRVITTVSGEKRLSIK
mgnify:CR=1 FL=1